MSRLLYRGINPELYEVLKGELRPKLNGPFVSGARWGEAEWGNSYWGENSANAVIDHQKNQAGLPTSGVSTTPHIDRAIVYATHGGRYKDGFIFLIERDHLELHGVSEYVVNAIVPRPSVPEDDEIILVARDYGPLPAGIIVEIKYIET